MATRRIGIPGTTTTRWGEHLCAFFYTKADLLNLIVPYVKAGLEDNEFCLWITGGPVTKTEAFEALKAALPAAQRYVESNQLAIIPSDEWYLSAGRFDPQKSFENWARKTQAAEANGFTGARTTGNPFWLQTEEEWAQFLRYEGTVNRAIESQRVISLCTYPVNICTSRHMLGTFSTHHAMLMTHGDQWQCLDLRPRPAVV